MDGQTRLRIRHSALCALKFRPAFPNKESWAFVCCFLAARFQAQSRIKGIEIALIQRILHDLQAFGKALIVHNLTLAQIAQHILHIRIIRQKQQIFVSCARLLFWYDLARTTYESFSEVPMYFNRNVFRLRNAFSYANMVNQHFYSFAG